MSYCCTRPGRVMDFLHGVYKPLGIDVRNDSHDTHYYSAIEIAQLLSVYSVMGRPHAHAVAAIISIIGIPEYHTIVVPFGLVGMMVRYDWHVVEAVRDWIEQNDKPHAIPHLNFYYHVYYHRKPWFYSNDDDYYDGENDYSTGGE